MAAFLWNWSGMAARLCHMKGYCFHLEMHYLCSLCSVKNRASCATAETLLKGKPVTFFASIFGLGIVCNFTLISVDQKTSIRHAVASLHGYSTFGSVPAPDLSEFTRHDIRKLISILEYRVVRSRDLHHLSAFRRREVTSFVVLQYSHVRVDVVDSHRATVDEPPAVVVVHVHARRGIDHRLHRVVRWTEWHLSMYTMSQKIDRASASFRNTKTHVGPQLHVQIVCVQTIRFVLQHHRGRNR